MSKIRKKVGGCQGNNFNKLVASQVKKKSKRRILKNWIPASVGMTEEGLR
jgi:hypothetical protein